jgi:D-proline reductase (dithiol) PrdD
MKKEMSTLTIKAFNISDVEFSDKTEVKNRVLYLKDSLKVEAVAARKEFIKDLSVKIIHSNERNVFVNSILDFSPIAAKVIGRLGEGVTHVLTGVCVMMTAVDAEGIQVAEFGSSEGILENQVVFNRAGTPSDTDIIIHVDLVLQKGMGTVRKAITEAHKACDYIVQDVRECIKKNNGRFCDEKHEYVHTIEEHKKNVVIVKQVAGQGAMYDTCILPNEPSGVEGSKSIIDLGNAPIVLTPNEYRDGALRAMH